MRRLIATAVASSKIAVIFFPFAQTQERGSLRREGPAPRKNPVLGISQSTLMPCVPRSAGRSEEHTSELESLMRNSYAVFCLKKKTNTYKIIKHKQHIPTLTSKNHTILMHIRTTSNSTYKK